jgi:hypothetical protein
MGKTDPIKLAQQFMGLNADDFRMFWTIVGLGIDDEDGDLMAQWDYCGQKMKPRDLAIISILHSTVAGGVKSAQKGKTP